MTSTPEKPKHDSLHIFIFILSNELVGVTKAHGVLPSVSHLSGTFIFSTCTHQTNLFEFPSLCCQCEYLQQTKESKNKYYEHEASSVESM